MSDTQTFLNIIFWILVGASICAGVCFLGICLFLYWIGKGESDVNGDPERDSGSLPEKKVRTCHWCPKEIPGDPEIQGICFDCSNHFQTLARKATEQE